MVAQRVYGLCPGYEDINGQDQLRYDPLTATLRRQTDVQGAAKRRWEQQLYLFADRTNSATMRENQLRLWFSLMAYILMHELRRLAPADGKLAHPL